MKVCVLLLFIKAILSQMTNLKTIIEDKMNINNKFELKTSGFDYTNPLFYGSVSGGVGLIILLLIIYCICRKKESNNEEEIKREIDNIDQEEVKTNRKVDQTVDQSKKDDKEQDKTKLVNNLSNDMDKSNRQLFPQSPTPSDKRDKKIIDLHNDFNIKLANLNLNGHHDHEEFYKPIKHNSSMRINSDTGTSRLSKLTVNGIIKKKKYQDIAVYTDHRRSEPDPSFYEKKNRSCPTHYRYL